jgi:hypothetical protein
MYLPPNVLDDRPQGQALGGMAPVFFDHWHDVRSDSSRHGLVNAR